MNNNGIITVQPDRTIIVDVHHPLFEEVRSKLFYFAELVKTPEHNYFYRITPISIWNSSANNVQLNEIIDFLKKYSKFDIPENVIKFIIKNYESYGKIIFEPYDEENFIVKIIDEELKNNIEKIIEKYIEKYIDDKILINKKYRGIVKKELIRYNIPVKDLAGYELGSKISINLKEITNQGINFSLRYYQIEAIKSFCKWIEGSGVIVLPCGAGKTIVGIGIISELKEYTLIITTSLEAVNQWKKELLDKTTISEEDIGEYTTFSKSIKPITITTYHMIIHKGKNKRNINIFTELNWGLIIYDEVHILPAPIFRITTNIQSKRRLGLTATLVREDNLENDVFTLIGPKIYEYPWKILEREGWIANAYCFEIKLPLTEEEMNDYLTANQRKKFKIASENRNKLIVLQKIIEIFKNKNILIIGHYLKQLEEISQMFGFPLITGDTAPNDRKLIYDNFRNGKIKVLVISRVGNVSIDLPAANVAIQVSGIFGSRQEEAQRLGRILRPHSGNSYFISLISKNTIEEEFSRKRQMFLLEQGYKYKIIDSDLLNNISLEVNNYELQREF